MRHYFIVFAVDAMAAEWSKKLTSCQSGADLKKVIRDIIDECVAKQWEIRFEFVKANEDKMKAYFDLQIVEFKAMIG